MKIAFYGTKPYDENCFNAIETTHEIKYFEPRLTLDTVKMAEGYDAVCIFVNDDANTEVVKKLAELGVKCILLRCAGFNNVDMETAEKCGIQVLRVPGYSPEAVAEHAMTIAMAANRRIHKAYNKVRDNDYSLVGLSGVNLFGKTAGIVGTGRIGAAMIRICKGFGMRIIAYDAFPNEKLAKEMDFEYASLEDVLKTADLISLHCPLMDNTYHLINKDTIALMKKGVILVNTSRGGLIDTDDLIAGIKNNIFHAVALDVYEEESSLVFEDLSDTILEHTVTARLLSFPNVLLTSHQGFFTREAIQAIAETTIQNANEAEKTITAS